VAPGETLQVSVSSPDRTRFVGITVVMEDPIEIEQKATSLPARFAIKIPEHIDLPIRLFNEPAPKMNEENAGAAEGLRTGLCQPRDGSNVSYLPSTAARFIRHELTATNEFS
jgi:hypothetical protein